MPGFQLYRRNGEDVNRDLLEKWATDLAPYYLMLGDKPHRVTAKGWYTLGLSGKVGEIRISQDRPGIEADVNTWYLPSGNYRVNDAKDVHRSSGTSELTAVRSASGAALAEHQTVLVSTPILDDGGIGADNTISVKILAAIAVGVYSAKMFIPPASAPAGALAEANVGGLPDAVDCWVHNLIEIGAGAVAGNVVPAGTDLVGRIAGSDGNGQAIVHVAYVGGGSSSGMPLGGLPVERVQMPIMIASGVGSPNLVTFDLDTADWRNRQAMMLMRYGPNPAILATGDPANVAVWSWGSGVMDFWTPGGGDRLLMQIDGLSDPYRWFQLSVRGTNGHLKLATAPSNAGTPPDLYYHINLVVMGVVSGNVADYRSVP